MTNRQLARIHAALRVRQHLRQSDVAAAAGIGRWKVVKIEAGEIEEVLVGQLRRSFEALGARLDLVASFRGAELDRLLDEVHARLAGAVVDLLERRGWIVKVEVSYSVRGERGSIDVLAWHAGKRALLVLEIKSELPGVDPLLRPLDVKVRLAPAIARDQFGWDVATVSRIVVFPRDRTVHRQVGTHATLLRAALPSRSREIRRWLGAPGQSVAGIWFVSLDGHPNTARNRSAIRRVQRPRTSPASAAAEEYPLDVRLIDPHRVSRTQR